MSDDDPDPFPENGGIRPDAGSALTIHDLIDPHEETA